MADAAADRLAIRELLENWVVWRDAGDWERFATVWHDEVEALYARGRGWLAGAP